MARSFSQSGSAGAVAARLLVGLFLFLLLIVSAWLLRSRTDGGGRLPVLSQVERFALTNHLGGVFDSAELRGRVWVADIVFTRCAGPCPLMTANLSDLQRRLDPEIPVHFVTLTADPGHDSPEVLEDYARYHGADTNRWHFLTGKQADIYRVATGSLLLAVAENPDPENAAPQDLFIHSTKLALVDAQGRVRGLFDGEHPEGLERLRRALDAVLEEANSPSEES